MSERQANSVRTVKSQPTAQVVGGLAGWFLRKMRGTVLPRKKLVLVERITIGPRQSVALVEAEGQRILVAMSAEGAPAFLPLLGANRDSSRKSGRLGRIAW